MNLEQLQAMGDEQLDEAVALAQGWVKHRNHWFDYKEPPTVSKPVCLEEDYRPTADTVEGKAQSFDLMVKYKLDIAVAERFDNDTRVTMWAADDTLSHHHENLQRAIVIASILSAQENKDD